MNMYFICRKAAFSLSSNGFLNYNDNVELNISCRALFTDSFVKHMTYSNSNVLSKDRTLQK